MKYLFLILLGTFLYSCSASKLYQQGKEKIEKAIAKDPSLKEPAIVITKTDTLIQIDTVNNTITKTITKTEVRDTCNFDNDDRQLTRRELRHQRKLYSDSLKHERRMHRIDNQRFDDSLAYLVRINKELTKQIRDTNSKDERLAREKTKQEKGNWFQRQMGKIWWLLLIIGLVAGLFIKSWIPKIPNPFK